MDSQKVDRLDVVFNRLLGAKLQYSIVEKSQFMGDYFMDYHKEMGLINFAKAEREYVKKHPKVRWRVLRRCVVADITRDINKIENVIEEGGKHNDKR